jgi:hypothetical protein
MEWRDCRNLNRKNIMLKVLRKTATFPFQWQAFKENLSLTLNPAIVNKFHDEAIMAVLFDYPDELVWRVYFELQHTLDELSMITDLFSRLEIFVRIEKNGNLIIHS